MTQSSIAIETHDLVKRFPRTQGWRDLMRMLPQWRDRLEITALDKVNLSVNRGEIFGLLGPNGAGKTTLIKVLCALIVPTAGHALVNGHTLRQEHAIKTSVGLITSDERSFYWRLSGRDNLIFFGRLYGLGKQEAVQRTGEVLDQVSLTEVADRRVQSYSAGMKQRLAIARGLLHVPTILFLDEPTRSLDPNSTHQIHTLVREELTERLGTTIFLSTHRLDEASALCDRIAILDHGQVRACGTLNELRGLIRSGQHYEIIVRNLAQVKPAKTTLDQLLPDLQIQIHPGNTTHLIFTAFDHTTVLQQVLEYVWSAGGEIQAIQSQPTSLHKVFTQVTGADKASHE